MNRETQRIIDSAPEEHREQLRQTVEATELLKRDWPPIVSSLVAITQSDNKTERNAATSHALVLIAAEVLKLKEDVRKLTALL